MLRTLAARLCPLALAPLLWGCSHDVVPWDASFADPEGPAATQMAIDGSGNVALAGTFQGSLALGSTLGTPGTQQGGMYVGMLDPGGQPLWSLSTTTTGPFGVSGVAVDGSSNVIVAGDFSGNVNFGSGQLTAMGEDLFVAKLGKDGSGQWAKQFGVVNGYGLQPGGLAVDGQGNIAFGGSFSGSFDLGGPTLVSNTGLVGFVAKLDPNGGHLFSTAFGGASNSVTALAFDGDSNLFVGGTNQTQLVVGDGHFASAGGNGFVVKLGADGTPLWAFQLGGDNSSVVSIAADGDGNVIVGGSFSGSLIAGKLKAQAVAQYDSASFVLAVDGSGQPRWLHALADAQMGAVAATGGAAALVTGSYTGAPNFGAGPLPESADGGNAFALRYDGSGSDQGTVTFVSTPMQASSFGSGVGTSSSGVVIAGTYSGTLRIGTTQLEATGPSDLFAARIGL